ncbi:MAG: HD domain-containing protein [Patescibacteria group bacterium]|nr:HD domain-containing protein [Patescibacteria group bacterium]
MDKYLGKTTTIPQEIQFVIDQLKKQGYEAYIVGGCVRDILRGVEPQDWDIATNAKPEEIGRHFLRSFANNKFGTVTVQIQKPKFMEIEVTPFRLEAKYTDKRHPDVIRWAKNIKQDLARRDFTVNAMAIKVQSSPKHPGLFGKRAGATEQAKFKAQSWEIIDLFGGQEDLKNKIIRAVGKAKDRFSEDALRMLRAIRFAVSLDQEKTWQIEEKTFQGIKKNNHLLSFISKERIRDELLKIINSRQGARGIEILRRAGLLCYIIPELEEGFGVWQNKHHIYQVYQHGLLSLNYACQKNFSNYVRLAALLHDIGKPRVKRGEGLDSTFYNHEIVGSKITCQILSRLHFPKKEIEKIAKLVKYHLFYYNIGEVGDSSVRRLLRKVGQEDIEELLQVRQSDRIGSGVPKAEPYKLRHLKYVFEKVAQDPISPKMLKVDGRDVMKILKIGPGPKIGKILTCLLGDVLKDPEKNNRTYLGQEIVRLGQKMSDSELNRTFNRTREEIEKIETKRDEMTKKKYWVT